MTDEITAPLRSFELVLLRDELKLDQKAFGQLIGVSERTVRGWEGGARIPDSAQFTLRLLRHCIAFPETHAANAWGDGLKLLLGRKP